MTKKRNKYNYQKFTITFDLDYEEERIIVEWMKNHKAKKNNFNVMMKKGIKLLMIEKEREENIK